MPKKTYAEMNWKELSAVVRKKGLDQRLTSFKGVEGAGEDERVKMISQLNTLDHEKGIRTAKFLSILSIVLSAVLLIVALIC